MHTKCKQVVREKWFTYNFAYLSIRPDHPWYPSLMRLLTVASLRDSLRLEIKKMLKPFCLISWNSVSV